MEIAWIVVVCLVLTGATGVAWYRSYMNSRVLLLMDEHRSTMKTLRLETEKRVDRVERSSAKDQIRAEHRFASDLLVVVDALSAATDLPEDTDAQSLSDGVRLVRDSFEGVFLAHDIHPISPEPSERFDPSRHEAVDLRLGYGREEVAECLRVGFRQGDAVLRPAMVAVGSGVMADSEE